MLPPPLPAAVVRVAHAQWGGRCSAVFTAPERSVTAPPPGREGSGSTGLRRADPPLRYGRGGGARRPCQLRCARSRFALTSPGRCSGPPPAPSPQPRHPGPRSGPASPTAAGAAPRGGHGAFPWPLSAAQRRLPGRGCPRAALGYGHGREQRWVGSGATRG